MRDYHYAAFGPKMKLSIVIAVLDSQEIVLRQLAHFKRVGIAEQSVELVLIDDGSNPSLIKYLWGPYCPNNEVNLGSLRIIETRDFRRWTQGLARMKGIKEAQGEYIFCTDIDHIISKEAIDFALQFDGDKAVFQRRFAYLDEKGNLVRDRQKLLDWGLLPSAIRDNELSDGVHGNTWLMRKDLFQQLGGYALDRCNSGTHLQGEDREFNHRYTKAVEQGKAKPQVKGPPIYFFPMGRYHIKGDENPFGLFHNMVKEKWGE